MVQAGAVEPPAAIEHDPEKWVPVLRKDHAQTKRQSGMTIRRKVIPLWRKATLD
jgi:hypothetical protein